MTKFIGIMNENLAQIKKEKKTAYLIGDFNINLLNEGTNQQTNEFIENILAYSFH